ncbi:MAG TPA: hypothetical protein VLT36_06980 [Candidatus Dormibacteraeota bacterium]|nr:hypothetical protein [Candidatus Dormibacteraeota bacterium]
MATYNLYSKQQSGQDSGVYRHDQIPPQLRNQFLHIFNDVIGSNMIGPMEVGEADQAAAGIRRILLKEYGKTFLSPDVQRCPRADLTEFFQRFADVNQFLDVVQLTFLVLRNTQVLSPRMSVKDGINELNQRFKEHRIGYQFVDGQLIKLSSEHVFQEITAPALTLLRENYLAGANQEFLCAHEHFRHARYKECLNECLKAFESTMKAICHKRRWAYNQTDTAKVLIKICEDNKLFPVFMENHLTGLRMSLEAGVPTARNKTSGHGQGVTPVTVSEEFARYVLNLTAANILFLVNSEKKCHD